MTFHIPQQEIRCPSCQHPLNRLISNVDGPPEPMQASVCAYCAGPAIYDANLQLQILPGAAFERAHPDSQALLIGYVCGAIDRLVSEGDAPSGMSLQIDEAAGVAHMTLRHFDTPGREVQVDRDVFAFFDTEDRLTKVEVRQLSRLRRMRQRIGRPH